MNLSSVTFRTAVALVLATSAVFAEEEGTTTTTVTESGTSGGRTFRRQTTVTRSRSSGKSRKPGDDKKSTAARKKARFKTGDDVLVEHGGDIFSGKVAGVDKFSGWVHVKFEDEGGDEQIKNVPPGNLISAVYKGKKLQTGEPGLKGEFEVGDEVLAVFGGVHIAEVVEIAATGWVKVRYDNDGFEMTPTLPPHDLRLIESEPVSLADAAALRTWSSQGGKFTIKAKFVELRDDAVSLEKEDGKVLTVALDKLSADDQDLARRLAEEAGDERRTAGAKKK